MARLGYCIQLVLRAKQPLSFASSILDNAIVGSYPMRFMIFLGATWRLFP